MYLQKKYLYTALFSMSVFIFSVPYIVDAHVKWFVDTDDIIKNETTHFSLIDIPILIWLGVLIIAICVAVILEKYIRVPKKIEQFTKTHAQTIVRVFEIIIGAHMLLAISMGTLVAPVFTIEGSLVMTAAVAGAIAGGLLIIGKQRFVAAMLLLLLYILMSIHFGVLAMIEHIHIVGLACFMALQNQLPSTHAPYQKYALPLLRVTTGIALIFLGLQEKLLHPQLGLTFLESHQWNFMQTLGFSWFTNELFIISAGMTEILFGILFLLGTITRINTIALTVFFITTAIVLGPTEINGHLTLVAIALLFILMGSGNALKIFSQKKQ